MAFDKDKWKREREARKAENQKGPQLKRDPLSGALDREQAQQVNQELLQKFLTEKRLHEKDESLHVAKGGRRDVVIHLAVTKLARVDGHPVLGEKDQEYNQWCFEIPASQLPVKNSTIIRGFAELCHLGKQALMALGMVRP